MFLLLKVGPLHRTVLLIEIADGFVGEEVFGFHKSEVHGLSPEVVEHNDVSVSAEPFPAVGCLMALPLPVEVMLIELVWSCQLACSRMFRCGTAFMTHIEEVVGVAHLDDVGVDDVEPSLWSLCEQCGLAGQRIELVVDVGIVYFVFAVALTGSPRRTQSQEPIRTPLLSSPCRPEGAGW